MSNDTVQIGEASVDIEALRHYIDDSRRLLDGIESYKTEFKAMVEAAAAKTGIEKKDLTAYLKARFKEETKATAEKGALFEALDDALEGNGQ